MGFLQRLFGGKKKKEKSGDNPSNWKLWSFFQSLNSNKRLALPSSSFNPAPYPDDLELDPNKHAIAVAVATAAVAEAALAAAQAAAEVVRLTGGGGGGVSGAPLPQTSRPPRLVLVEEAAAVKIQCAFRGYLARRALRALKALVKLQALVRGHMVRKRMTDMLRRMQTLVRLQARARASRNCLSASSNSPGSSSFHQLRCGSYASHSLDPAQVGSSWLDRWMEESARNNKKDSQVRNGHDDDKGTKILEVDTWKPRFNPPQNHEYRRTADRDFPSCYVSSGHMVLDSPLKHPISSRGAFCLNEQGGKGEALRYFENIQQANPVPSRPGSSSSWRDPFSPTKSEVSWGGYSRYLGHPSYMANTESSRAKVRSQSAPRQRVEFDNCSSMRRNVLTESWDGGLNSERRYPPHAEFRTRAYSERQHSIR
ncbi:protein IQ-DOMAIN 14-like [Punica granatum]|uniref:Protein IQ-DOMAIN 14-like n=1 Tax=Punica granatum TaxID=22663 RepID=A0A218WSP7_PUNGR|nr:protein IQ-DOMAIN 14-like [Punica granatum]OWM75636.1 hypothetical protein CDL15_Pgr021801 [Punica granatum]